MTDKNTDTPPTGGASRRSLLRLGAIAVPAALTIKPAFAAQTSIVNCEIPINNWVDKNGKVVAAGTPNSFPPPAQPYTAAELKLNGSSHRLAYRKGVDTEAVNAHMAYINDSVRKGKAEGLTCLASIMGPT
jgi:hypothetical protein